MTLEDKRDALIGLDLEQAQQIYPEWEILPTMEDGELTKWLEYGGPMCAVGIQNKIITEVFE